MDRQKPMDIIEVFRTDGNVEVMILPHKDGSGWSFVNLTKGHICPCRFESKEAAIKDLDAQPNILSYKALFQDVEENSFTARLEASVRKDPCQDKQKPPIGIMPEYIWKWKRYQELCEAIGRYVIVGHEPLPEWIAEGKKLVKEMVQ